MGFISIKDWLKLPLAVWHKSRWGEYTTFDADVRRLMGGISDKMLINHHDGNYVASVDEWKVNEDNYAEVDLGVGNFADIYHGMTRNIRDFIQLFKDVITAFPFPIEAPLPADVNVFLKIAAQSENQLGQIDLDGNCFYSLRMVGFWIFNSPAFFVEGERESFVKEIWRLKDHADYKYSIKDYVLDCDLNNWVEVVRERDGEGYLHHIHVFDRDDDSYGNDARGKRNAYKKIDAIFRFERHCFEHLKKMSSRQLELYLHDILPTAIPMMYYALFMRFPHHEFISIIRRPSKPFSWGGM